MKRKVQHQTAEVKSRRQQQSTHAPEQVAPAAAIPRKPRHSLDKIKESQRVLQAQHVASVSAQRFKEIVAKKSFSGLMRLSSRVKLDAVMKALAAFAMKTGGEGFLYVKRPDMGATYMFEAVFNSKQERAFMRARIKKMDAELLRAELHRTARVLSEAEGVELSYGIILA